MRSTSPRPSWKPLKKDSKPTIMVGIAPGKRRNWNLVAGEILSVAGKAGLGFPIWVELLLAAKAEH